MKQSDFLKAVLPFKDKIFRLAKRLLVSTEEAEDATQELYFKLWNNKERLADCKSVEAFAMTTTKNYCFDRLKSKQANNLSITHNNYKEKDACLDKKIENNDTVSLIHKLIEELPMQQKVIIQLRDIEQYEFDEIGKIVSMKPIAVRVALSRARKTIREKLIKKHSFGLS
ncbi:MAG: RNA polymerase sigma factor [Tenacibaculum sp.]